jgi:hypothetical protein
MALRSSKIPSGSSGYPPANRVAQSSITSARVPSCSVVSSKGRDVPTRWKASSTGRMESRRRHSASSVATPRGSRRSRARARSAPCRSVAQPWKRINPASSACRSCSAAAAGVSLGPNTKSFLESDVVAPKRLLSRVLRAAMGRPAGGGPSHRHTAMRVWS